MSRSDRLALAAEAQALALPGAGRVLVLRAEPSGFFDLVPPARLACVQSFRPLHDALVAEGRTVLTAAPTEPAAMVVVNVTRSRAETLGLIAAGLGLLPPGAPLVVAGAKVDGVDAVAKQVAGAMPLDGTFVKAHGRVVWLSRPATMPAAVKAWAEAARPAPNADGFVTAPGMFSPEHADPGSRRLAPFLTGLSGRVADLGAGWGWLALRSLAANPAIAALDLYEAEALALDAARANVTDPRAGFHWADATRLGPGGPRYDAVITNPPFHHARSADPALGAAFIAAAARILKPDGRLFLVANRQLPYEAPLAAGFRQMERLAEDGGYKVYLAGRPHRR